MVKQSTIDLLLECLWKKNKAFVYRVPIGDYNYLQCAFSYCKESFLAKRNCQKTTFLKFIEYVILCALNLYLDVTFYTHVVFYETIEYGNTGYGVFKQGYKIRTIFA